MKSIMRTLACAMVFFPFALAAKATPLFFQFNATASGDLNGTTFSNAGLLVTGTYDSNDVHLWSGNEYVVRSSLTYTIAGLGSFLGDGLGYIYNQNSLDGFAAATGNDVIDVTNPVFPAYKLGIMPSTAGTVSYLHFDNTSGGKLTFTAAQDATVQISAATPEPGSLALMLTGTAGIVSALRRRARGASTTRQ